MGLTMLQDGRVRIGSLACGQVSESMAMLDGTISTACTVHHFHSHKFVHKMISETKVSRRMLIVFRIAYRAWGKR